MSFDNNNVLVKPNTSTSNAADNSPMSSQAVELFTWIVVVVMCQDVNNLGILTNSINIACFVKQGFKESVNISLLGKTCIL